MTDLSKQPVLMQGFQPCCYEAAVCAYMEYLTFKKTGVYTPLSFRFLATLTAAQDGINYASGGTKGEVALQIAKTVGVCTAATYPNDITLSPTEFVMPSLVPQAARDEAANFKIADYEILTDISWEGMNAKIDEYGLVITSLYLDKEWYLSNVPNSNPLPIPPPFSETDPSKSPHATLSYGSDATYRYFRNSFGNTFGKNGDGFYSPAYQPYIFAGAVILDMVEVVKEQVQEVAQAVNTINPTSPTAPAEEGIIGEVLTAIEGEIAAL